MSRKLLSIAILVLLLSISQSNAIDQNRPETGTVIKDMDRDGYGTLTINNNWTMDTVAILTDRWVKPKMVVYLRAKDSLEIDGIEDGEYIPYFTIGDGWNATAKEFDKIYNHYRYSPVVFETTDLGEEVEGTVLELNLYEADVTNFVPGQFEFPDI
jgi:hypothetical protein